VRRTTVAALSLYGVAVALCLGAYIYDLDNYPPQFDYDSATLGIFVNNLTFNGRYDYGFNPSFFQDAYRIGWAAHFLPVSVPLGWVQRTLGVAFDDVGELLRVTGLLLGFFGCVSAAYALRPPGRTRAIDVAFIVGFTTVFTPFLLYLRTAVPHFMLSFLLFWLIVLLTVRWRRTRERWCLYALAAAFAYYALAPYPPLVVAPLVMSWLVIRGRALRRIVTEPHAYVAALLGVALYWGVAYGVAITHESTYAVYRERAAGFVAMRSGKAFALDRLAPGELAAKAQKLLDQHILFRRDQLGDTSREDDLWTVGAPHPGWLLLVPFAVVGLWRGLRTRDEGAEVAAAVVAASYAVAFLVSFPEGRYLITVIPCYAYFVLRGLDAVLRQATARIVGRATALFAMAVGTFLLVTGEYNAGITTRWWNMGGMRAVVKAIRSDYGNPSPIYLNWPELRYHQWLYLEMLANFRVKSTEDMAMLASVTNAPKGRRYFIVREAADTREIRRLTGAGFFKVGRELEDAATGRRVVLLVSG
jgi:hypothetical protein